MRITQKQYAQLIEKTLKKKQLQSATLVNDGADFTKPTVVLGIDPSLRCTGFGVIVADRRLTKVLDFGRIPCPNNWKKSQCLINIFQTLDRVIQKHKPEVCVIEGLFYAQNIKTALVMGEARGACIAAAAKAGIKIAEIAPRKVKQALVGYGAAQKLAVAKMVQRILGLAVRPESDAADALALAITFVNENFKRTLKNCNFI